MGETEAFGHTRLKRIPGTIRELLRRLIERRVTIVLDAEMQPESVEIEAVVGNLLVAEEGNHFKFVDIDCICEVIVGREELLEAILGMEAEEEEEKHKEEKHKKSVIQSNYSY